MDTDTLQQEEWTPLWWYGMIRLLRCNQDTDRHSESSLENAKVAVSGSNHIVIINFVIQRRSKFVHMTIGDC